MATQTNQTTDHESAPQAPMPAYPFDPAFYAKVLPDRVKGMCEGQPETVAVVKLLLADGGSLDLCHIALVTPGWMAVFHYRDIHTCTDMDLMFVPYALVHSVSVSMHMQSRRPIGFDPNATAKEVSAKFIPPNLRPN